MYDFSFGADPEFMLTKDGEYFSAIGIVPGTKDKRHKIKDTYHYYDNVMAECTIVPGNSKKETIESIRNALTRYAKLVYPYQLTIQASQDYPSSQLKHKDALQIGCDPEWCAYTMQMIKPPSKFPKGLRSAGGHIHIGYDFIKRNDLNRVAVIRMMDLFVGLPSIYMDGDSTTKRRKELYGKAGRFRPCKKYGVEYRTLGNFWLASPALVSKICDLTEMAVASSFNGFYKKMWNVDEKALNDDATWALPDFNPLDYHKCVGYNAKELRDVIDTMDRKRGEKFFDLIGFKVESVSKQPDLYKEWDINV